MQTERVTDTYVAQNGMEFIFAFERKSDDQHTIHILDQPDYAGRNTNPHITHRLSGGDGFTVCWTGPLPTIEEAKRRAGLWADYTARYIQTGEPFPNS